MHRRSLADTSLTQWMAEKDGRFNVNVLSVAKATKGLLVVGLGLLENFFLDAEKMIRVVVVGA